MINVSDTDKNIVKKLEALVLRGGVSHAVLISGGIPENRALAAYYLAGFTVCFAQDGKPCGQCEACRKTHSRVHPDIYIYEKPADKRSYAKKAVQEICESVYLTPNEANVKVLILSEIQNMNEECQNLLLRVLEEPPAYSSFILTASSKAVILPTVLSRVTKLNLGEAGGERYCDPKSVKTARAIARAVISPDEFDIIRASGELEGDKNKYTDVVLELSLIFRDALVKSAGGGEGISSGVQEAEDMAAVLSKKQLMKLYDAAAGMLADSDINKNKALMTACLSAQLRQAIQL